LPIRDSNTANTIGSGRAVLIAEDSTALTLLVRTLLTRWGFAATATPCDGTALAALETTRFDLVVVGASGSDAAAIIAGCSNGPPVLVLTTGDWDPNATTVALRLPIDAASLRDGVERCLNPAAGSLDHAAIVALWGSTDSPIFHRIVRVFTEEVRGRVVRIGELLPLGDMPAIEIEAHSIKGAAANVGAHGIRDAARRVEADAVRRDATALPLSTEALRHATDTGIAALERIVAPLGQS